MHWNRIMAAAAAGSAMAVATSLGIASSAVAAQDVPSRVASAQASSVGVGSFNSWGAAQAAAGFPLRKPGRTFGFKRLGKIIVTRCAPEVKSKAAHPPRLVVVSYGRFGASLGLRQNNSGKPCLKTGKLKLLGTFKVDGVKAQLKGLCGRFKFPSCSSPKIFLFLSWKKGGIFYEATSFRVRAKLLIRFGRSLRRAA